MSNYRAKKVGVALAIQKKQEERYNVEEELGTPARVVTWLNQVLDGAHPPCGKSDWRAIQMYLRDGIALCKMITKLRQAAGKSAVKFSKNACTAFVAMENIESFNKAAVDYGLDSADAFNSVDLYEGVKGPFINVINCLNRLGFVANGKGYTPSYEAIEPPKAD